MEKLKPTIKNERLHSLTEELKKHSTQWATLMAAEISATKEWKSYSNDPLTVENLRKISSGVIKGNGHRRMFVDCGSKLLDRFEKQAQKDREL